MYYFDFIMYYFLRVQTMVNVSESNYISSRPHLNLYLTFLIITTCPYVSLMVLFYRRIVFYAWHCEKKVKQRKVVNDPLLQEVITSFLFFLFEVLLLLQDQVLENNSI